MSLERVKTNPDLKDAPGFVPVYTAPQLAAARLQAINDAMTGGQQ